MSYVTAPIHDLLIRIKNAYMARKTSVSWITFSNFKVKILELLKQYQYIKEFEIQEDKEHKKTISISLKKVVNPVDDVPHIKFFSKPSRPRYVSYKNITLVAGGKGLGIMSTNQWLMPAHVAKVKKVWWELIAEIF